MEKVHKSDTSNNNQSSKSFSIELCVLLLWGLNKLIFYLVSLGSVKLETK
jgi:hypothetical protein